MDEFVVNIWEILGLIVKILGGGFLVLFWFIVFKILKSMDVVWYVFVNCVL